MLACVSSLLAGPAMTLPCGPLLPKRMITSANVKSSADCRNLCNCNIPHAVLLATPSFKSLELSSNNQPGLSVTAVFRLLPHASVVHTCVTPSGIKDDDSLDQAHNESSSQQSTDITHTHITPCNEAWAARHALASRYS